MKNQEHFWVRIVSGAFRIRLRRTLVSAECERLERAAMLQFGRELPSFYSGTRNFIRHNWSIG
jgi:hypothetical protein